MSSAWVVLILRRLDVKFRAATQPIHVVWFLSKARPMKLTRAHWALGANRPQIKKPPRLAMKGLTTKCLRLKFVVSWALPRDNLAS